MTFPWQRRLPSTRSAQAAQGFWPLMGLWTDATRQLTGPTALLLRCLQTQTCWCSWLGQNFERRDPSTPIVGICHGKVTRSCLEGGEGLLPRPAPEATTKLPCLVNRDITRRWDWSIRDCRTILNQLAIRFDRRMPHVGKRRSLTTARSSCGPRLWLVPWANLTDAVSTNN